MIEINKTLLDRNNRQTRIKEFLSSLEKSVKKIHPKAKLKEIKSQKGRYMNIPTKLSGDELIVYGKSRKRKNEGSICKMSFLDYEIEERIRLIKKNYLVGISGYRDNKGIFKRFEIGICDKSVEEEVMNVLNEFEDDFTIEPYALYPS